ncbi:MAG TPA: TonB-dependent receptor [Saprospiraceae bacterium]|nr:TonB-dependent receptor [Saprospiraceae bacterium]HMQ84150.1 TonB-dependent receptor [Saprospiraceae bacterium]
MSQSNKLTLTLILLLISLNIYAQRGVITGTVTDSDGMGLIGTAVEVLGTATGTVTDIDGKYTLNVNAGNYNLRFSYTGFVTATKAVSVSAGGTAVVDISMDEDLLGLSEVVVVGARANERTVTNSPVPVDVITAREIRASGATQTVQILQALVPSYNTTKPSITDGSDHFRPATLRGLGPDQVLVLVNGKRRHTSALVHVNGTVGRGSTGVDLNAIPASAIERIEVMRDGASAQYGSDAIAGVINIILRKDTGFDVEIGGGSHLSTFEKGYAPDEGLFDGITNDDLRNNGTLYSYDWLTTTENVSKTDGQRLHAHIGKGIKIGEGNFYLSGQYRKQGRTNRQGDDVRINYFTQSNGEFDPREATFDRSNNFRYGDAEFTDISGFINGALPVGGSEFYLFGGVSHRDGLSGCFFRRASDNRTVRSIYPDGFLPLINARLTDFSGVAGFRGPLGENWSYDFSQTVGKNAFALYMENTHNTSLGGLNEYTFPDPEVEQKTEMYDGTLNFLQATTNFDLSRSFKSGLASDINLAVGAEVRYEKYNIEPGEVTSYYDGNDVSGGVQDGPSAGSRAAAGCQCFPGWKDDVSDSRTAFGLYVELETQPIKGWTTALAGRFENFSDFGSTVNGKFATRLELAKGLALRGAVSTGFRAPSLGQGNYSAIQTTTVGTTLIETGFFPVETKVAQALGAQSLDAEKSLNLSAGITYTSGNFGLTIDGYQISITDRIILSEQFQGKTGVNGEDLLEEYLLSQGLPAAQGAYFTNALDTKTTGVDITARYGVNVGEGKLRFTFSANFNETEATNPQTDANGNRFIPTPTALLQYSETPLYGDLELNRLELANPKNVFNFIINYDVNKFTSMLRLVRYGSITWGEFNDFGDIVFQEFTPKIITDLELGYEITDGLSFHLGSNNLLDVYPDKFRKDLAFNGIFQYDGTNPVGFNGRYVYGRLTFHLD